MFEPLHLPNPTIHIVGVGGTGGYLIEYLSRLFADRSIDLHIYDEDVVEPKNLKRQNFTSDHIGQYKVTSFADRYTCIPHHQYVKDKEEFIADLLIAEGTPIVISCVDNVSTRKLLQDVFNDYPDKMVYIDSGNDSDSGKVVWSMNQPITYTPPFQPSKEVSLSTYLECYPELLHISDKNPAHMTCADRSNEVPQSMMANVRNASVIASLVHQMILNQPIAYHVYESDLMSNQTISTNKFK